MAGGRHANQGDRGVRRRVAVAAAAALLVPVAALSLVRAPDASAAATPALPFDLVAAPSTRLVLAHYVPWFPVSFDNVAASGDTYARAYLDPAGEGGKHAAYGGFLRDRPQARPVSSDPAWRDADMRQEVRDAISAGIDGFAVDIPSVSPTARSWASVVRLLRAAHDVDPSFRVLLQPDMVGLARFDSATIAAALATLADQPAAMRYDDGRLLVSPYFAEKRTVAWWTDWLGSMSLDHGIDVALFPVLQNDLVWGDDFAPISVGIGNWGSRNPSWNSPTSTGATSPRGRIAAAHARGNLWMQPVSVQDERPRAGLFDEAANTQNLRDTWKVARDGGADWVLLPTWNDYAEGTAIAPSLKHGRAFLDLMAYYTAWFKSGRAPQIVRDGVYLTHRAQQAGAAPVSAQSKLMVLRGGTPARDTVEALAFLTAPAVVTVTVGGNATSCALPAGVSPCVAPLRPGTVSAEVTRWGAAVASVVSPYEVTATPYVQDLQYVAVSSLRNGNAQPAAAASSASSPTRPAQPTPRPSSTTPPPAAAPSGSAPSPSSTSTTGRVRLTLASLATSSTTESRFVLSATPDVPGSYGLLVDGARVSLCVAPHLGGCSMGTGPLSAGRHTVVATFAPADPSLRSPSDSVPFVLTVP